VTNREKFSSTVEALGLKVTKSTSDGWYYSMERADGLHLWRLPGGIQTAWLIDGRYCDFKLYEDDNFDKVEGLKAAAARPGRDG
jgi:hypothetical protein